MTEFAIVIPVLMMLIFGMFTGGMAYNRKISLTNAAREGGRYGATLPVNGYATLGAWLDAVGAATVGAATGDLDSTVPGRELCIAYLSPGSSANDQTAKKTVTGASTFAATAAVTDGTGCFADGRPSSERRVQVQVRRTSKLEAILYSADLTLTSQAVTRYEASA